MTKSRTLLALITVLLVVVGAYWIWFFKWDIYTWGDWGFYFPQMAKEFIAAPQVWSSLHLGGVDIGLPLYPLAQLLPGLLSQYMEPYMALHIVYLLPNIIFCALGAFFLSRYIFKSNLAGVIASFVFSFNTYFLIIRGGHLPLMNAFSMAPFALLAFLHGLRTSKVYFFILAGAIGSVASIYEVRGAYMLFGLIGLMLVFHLRQISMKTLLASSATLITALFLNIFWISGLFFTGGSSDLPVFGRQLYGEGYAHIVRSAVLQLYQWGADGLIGPGVQETPVYMWLIPLLAFTGLYFGRKNRLVLYFGVVSLLGIFFSKMTGQPFPNLYAWMYSNFPGFSVFREPSKFFFLIAIGYSILLSGVGVKVMSIKKNTFNWKLLKVSVLFMVMAPFLINARGVVTGQLGELLKPRAIPSDNIIVNDFLLKQDGFFRTIYYPSQSRWNVSSFLKPGLSGLVQSESDWSKLNNYNITGLEYTYKNAMTNIFKYEFKDKLFDMAAIKYLVIPARDIANNDDMFSIYGDRNGYVDFFAKEKFLKRIDIGTTELIIYENSDYRPRIYLTNVTDSIYTASISAQPVDYQRISSSEYRIRLPQNNNKMYLNFSEHFHPGWSISPDRVSWVNVILGRQKFIDQEKHIKNDAGLNSYAIDHEDVNDSEEITLYFRPQAYLELGMRVTVASAIFVVAFLIIYPILNKRNA